MNMIQQYNNFQINSNFFLVLNRCSISYLNNYADDHYIGQLEVNRHESE